MPDRIRKIVSFAAILLGCGHLVFGVLAYKALTPEHIWFAGAGIAMICVGFSNLRASARVEAGIVAAYFAVMVSQIPLPQVFIGLAIFIVLAVPTPTKRKV